MKKYWFSNKYKIKLVVLTLKDYPKRLDILSDILDIFEKSGLYVDIFYGINGKNIIMQDTDDDNVKLLKYESKTYYYNKSKRANGKVMTNGELGASWSHLDIYKSFLQDEKYDNCIIFEDDFQLLVNIPTFLDYLKNLPEIFDICHICLSDFYPFDKTRQINKYFYKISYDSNFNRATAYIISKSGAKKLLQYSNGFVNIPPDDLLCGIYLYSKLNCEFFVPDKYLFKEIEGTISNVVSINS